MFIGKENLTVQLIAHNLKRIQSEGGDSNFVIFIANQDANYYIQVAGQNGDSNLYIEAVNNDYISRQYKLEAAALSKLKELGWADLDPDGSGNYYQNWQVNSDEVRLQIAVNLMNTFMEVYGFDSNYEELEVNLNLE